MRNKWLRRVLPIIALSLLALWPVSYAYAYSDDTAGQDTVQIEVAEASLASTGTVSNAASGQTSQALVQEPTDALPARLVSNDSVIMAPPGILPSHVYVLNNREIVTEKTWYEMNKSRDTVEEPSSHSETASAVGTVRACVTVTPSRLMVVDGNGRIVEIWSNTTGTKRDFYSLRVREQSWQGVEHPLTPGILAQYNRLLGEVDWSINGRAYSAEIQ